MKIALGCDHGGLNLKQEVAKYLETENIELRNVLQTLRNALESFEYDLVKISESKGYLSVTSNTLHIPIKLTTSVSNTLERLGSSK